MAQKESPLYPASERTQMLVITGEAGPSPMPRILADKDEPLLERPETPDDVAVLPLIDTAETDPHRGM